MYCNHKSEDMINVVSKQCMYCTKRPSYNQKGKKALYCLQHKEVDMIDVLNKACMYCPKPFIAFHTNLKCNNIIYVFALFCFGN